MSKLYTKRIKYSGGKPKTLSSNNSQSTEYSFFNVDQRSQYYSITLTYLRNPEAMIGQSHSEMCSIICVTSQSN